MRPTLQDITISQPASLIDQGDTNGVLALTKAVLRFDPTDTQSDVYITNCVDQASAYLARINGITIGNQVTVSFRVAQLNRGDNIRAPVSPVSATTVFGEFTGAQGQTAADYFNQIGDGWIVERTQQIQSTETALVTYTASGVLTEEVKGGVAQCAAHIFNNGGTHKPNTLSHLQRTYVV